MGDEIPSKRYDDITPEKWRRIQRSAATCGMPFEAYQGNGEAFGIKLRWAYGRASQKLLIQVESSLWMSRETALNTVDGLIQSAIDQATRKVC